MSSITRPSSIIGTPVDPDSPGGSLIAPEEFPDAPFNPAILLFDGPDLANSEWQYSAPVSGPPSGPAGGDLSGTYPNPTVATVGGATAASIAAAASHPPLTNNPHNVTAAQTGAIPTTEKGAANGVATLDVSSEVPLSQLKTFIGATDLINGEAGIVPAPVAGDDDTYLRGDGTWSTVTTITDYAGFFEQASIGTGDVPDGKWAWFFDTSNSRMFIVRNRGGNIYSVEGTPDS